MKARILSLLLLPALCLLSAAAQTADGLPYTYDDGKAGTGIWGTNKKETYDVALRIKQPDLVGATVSGVTLRVPESDALGDLKIWLTKELSLESVDGKKQNVPDITSQEADIQKAFKELYIPFEHPYTLTEEGVYVGYTLTATDKEGNASTPILLSYNTYEDGFFIHTTRTYLAWKDLSSLGSLAFSVNLTGVPANGASAEAAEMAYTVTGEGGKLPLTVYNQGTAGVKSFEVEYTIGGQTRSQTFTLPGSQQLAARFGESAEVEVALPAMTEDGTYPLNLTLTKVNGEPNGFARATAESEIDARRFVPRRRTVMEEYTGAWCSNCPRGYAAIEIMKRLHADDFIAIAYHNKDSMEVFDSKQFPADVESFPSCTLDRSDWMDPYFGTTFGSPFHIEQDWLEATAVPAPADISASAKLSADGTEVSAQATVTAPRGTDGSRYSVEFVLTADDLHGTGGYWAQSNDLVGADRTLFPEKEFDIFVNGASYVQGLHFDDVAIATTRINGGNAALPEEMEAYKDYSVAASLPAAGTMSLSGHLLPLDLKKLHVVALLIDREEGTVANAVSCAVDASDYVAGIHSATADSEAAAETFCTDLSGRRVAAPAHGVFLLSRKAADGSVVTRKVIR